MSTTIPPTEERRPLVVSVCRRAIARRLFGRATVTEDIDWRATIAEMFFRAVAGLFRGVVASICFLIFVYFTDGQRHASGPTLFEQWGEPGWIDDGSFIPFIMVGVVLYQIATTRATVRDSGADELPGHF